MIRAVILRRQGGSVPLHLEVAATPQQRERGLQDRIAFVVDCGMIFVLPEDSHGRFHNFNTYLRLDISFLRRDGTILETKPMQSIHESQGVVESYGPSTGTAYRYALETPRGLLAANGVRPGDRLLRLAEA